MSSRASDVDLLRRVAARDEAAGAELFNRYANDVLTYLCRNANRSEAEDLLQEVFERALRGASRFEGRSGVRTWLHSIARYALSERRRARWSQPMVAEGVSPMSGPESLSIRADEMRRIVAALEKLPDEQAIVLQLHLLDGHTHDEIAGLLGIEPAASRKRLQRAQLALQRAHRASEARRARHSRVETWRTSLFRRFPTEERTDG